MKAILKPFFALCGLVALSTALSADSRLFPVGGGGAGWGEPGFLYSDYLQTAAASGREVEFQGSFVLDNRRPFLAELGTAFPGRVVDEVKSLPLREWGLGYVFEKRRPAHQRALLERGWRLADWLAEETLMAATESSRGGGLIRTLEFDLQSELGGRRAQVGLNVLGALRESNDEAIAWQFRGFKSSGGLGGNTGLIWRRAVANDRALAGANVFLDYETYADENFWRGSAGAELRSAWADVFGNVYRGFSDDVKKNNRTTYTADGYDVELNVHSPELPWLVGEVAYYNFEGKAGDKDDDGVRFGLRFNPLTDLELGVEYDNGDSDDDGKKKWAARIRYSGEFGGVLKAQYRPSTNSGNFEPRDWFFAPAEREYSQRIRKSGGDSGFQITVAGVTEGAFPLATYPIELRGALSLDITSTAQLPRVINVSGGTVILSHKTGQVVSLFFPRTRVSVITRSTVAFSLDGGREVFSLLEGQADIVMSTLSRGMLVVEQRVTAAATSDDRYRQITLSVATRPVAAATLLLTVKRPPANANIDPARDLPLPILVPVAEALGTVGVVAVTNSGGTPTNLTAVNFLASVELANDNSLTDTSPPSYYKGAGASPTMIVLGTLQTSGGGGAPYTSSKVVNSGDLLFSGGVVSIPTSAIPATGDGKTLTLQIMVNDNPSDTIGAQTDPQIVGFTVVYREIVPLAASLPGFSGIPSVYGVLGDSARKVVATAAVVGSGGAITYSPIDGALRLDAGHVVYIPAGNPPAAGSAQTGGNLLTLNSEIRQAASGGVPAMTVTLGLTVRYIGIPAVGANLNAIAPAISTGQNSFDITAQAGDTGRMEVLNVVGTGGAGGGFTMRMTDGDLSFDPSNGRVYISQSTTPRPLPYSVVIAIDDLGTGATETPTYTLTVRVQYDSVEVIRVNFNDPDGLVTVYGLQGQTTVYANVAQVETGGGFGAITVGKVGSGGVLDLRNGTEIFIPQGTAPTGQDLAITVSGNDSEASDPNGITDAATAILTLEYAQVPTLNATFLRVSPRNGQVGTALPVRVLTVGMTQAITTEFTVAKVMAEGGVGGNANSEYTYTRAGGSGALSVNDEGEVLIAAGTQPGADQRMEIIVRVDDTGTNSQISPAFLASLTVLYNTIGIIGAEVMDTRPGATPATLPDSGGKVYFISGGATANQVFGRVNIFGGLGNQHSDYEVAVSNDSGLAYDQGTGNLSMTKCGAQTPKTIRLTINDKNDDGGITEPFVFNFSVVSGGDECLSHVSADVEDLSGTAVAGTLLRYGLEAVNAPSDVAVATVEVSGGAGDLTAAKTSGGLNLDGVLSNALPGGLLLTVEIPAGTTPAAVGSNDLVLVAVVNDANANGGFLTDPATVSVTANYVAVPSVVLNLNNATGHPNAGNAIADVVTVYGVESATNDATVAAYAASGGASGANVAAVLHSDTTENSFAAISGASGDLKLNLTFPAFDAPRNVIAAVSANDTGGTQAHTDATPEVVKRATVRLLPVLGRVEEGGDIVVQNLNNVIQPSATSKTETEFTVYALASAKEERVIARINPASVARNAAVDGLSGLRLVPFDSTTTGSGTGLDFELEGQVAAVKIADSATPTSSGADLNLVLTYVDEANAGTAAADVAVFTQPRMKTVNVKYVEVAAFEPEVRQADGAGAALTAPATVYAAAADNTEKLAAKLVKVGGAAGDMRVISRSGATGVLEVRDNGEVWVRANQTKSPTDEHVVAVVLNDANTPEGSVTPQVTRMVTVVYEETRDVVASLSDIPGNDHFLGAADSTNGVRTLYFKDGATRPAELDILRININGGTEDYTTNTNSPFGLDGFMLKAGTGEKNRVLALLAAKADGATAQATVEIDDTGTGEAISKPATIAITVAVKDVSAIAAELLVLENVPGGAPVGTTLGGLYVRSAAAANSSSVYIASVVARGGVEEFTYTRQSESSAELLLNDDGQVHLAQNYTPDGDKTLSIIIAVNDGDSVDGSTLTEAAMITLQFVLAETIGAELFARSDRRLSENNIVRGAYLPDGAIGNVAWGSGTRTIRVKAADYGSEHLVVGVRASGGLGTSPTYSIARATGGNENGLVTRTPSPDTYGLAVAVKSGASGSSNTFGITALINESTNDPNNLTPPATISVTVLYTAVEPIAGAFEDMDGNAISGNKHVVVKSDGTAAGANEIVASIEASGGVGNDNGGSYTFSQVGNESGLIVNNEGKIRVRAGILPKTTDNELTATVRIVDSGDWDHVSDDFLMTVTVVYSSEVQLQAVINDTRDNAVPAQIPQEGGTVYFLEAGTKAGAVFGNAVYSGALENDRTYIAAASDAVGLAYDASTRNLSMTKCSDPAQKSIILKVNDSPDANSVSKELTVGITLTSGPDQCLDPITATPRSLSGQLINADVVRYAVEGSTLAARMAVATVLIAGGAPEFTSSKSGGDLELDGNRANLLTVYIPAGTSPATGASGNELDIAIAINDNVNKGGFLTDAAEVNMTVNYIAVARHGQFTADKVAGVEGDVASGMLTVRRVVAATSNFNILTNIKAAIPNKEAVGVEGSYTGILYTLGNLQMEANQPPNGLVRIITLKVSDNSETETSEPLQSAARPDRLFTISVHYLGELDAAAYDSENIADAITAPINRYVEQGDSDVSVAVASLSVSGGNSPYTYNLVGGLEFNANSTTVQIPATATPADPGLVLTAGIVINDNNRADTNPLTLGLTANYILIPGHSDLQLVRDGKTDAEDLNGETVYPKIVSVKSSGVVEALSGLAFKAGLSGETLKRESSGSAAALLYADDASVVQIAGDTEPDGSTLALVLRASDGESPAQAKARSDRLYTVQVRYMKELTADARDAASGGDVINAVRQIRVTEAEATEAHFVAHISVDGGAGGNEIAVEGTNFVINGNELQIAADVTPGDFASGKLLTATVKVNDDDSLVGGADTGEVEILVTANYITLPPVEGSFVEGRDGTQNVPTSAPVTVFSAYTAPNNNAPATVAATAKATVTGRDDDTFTFHKIGEGGILDVDETSGAVTLAANRPTGGNNQDYMITVEFRAAANAVHSRLTLTVKHQMIRPITSTHTQAFQSRAQCHPGAQQNGQSLLRIVVDPGEEGSDWVASGQCSYLAFGRNDRVGRDDTVPKTIIRSVQTDGGLNLNNRHNHEHIVGVTGNRFTYTADLATLSIVIAYNDQGPGDHITEAFLRTIYVVFPGVPKLNAVLKNTSGAEITKPLTAYVAAAGDNVVASLDVSGGTGGYTYTGNAIEGSSLAVNASGKISVPSAVVPQESPGTTFKYEVTVNDAGTNAGVTPARKVILTLQYIKTSGPLNAAAVLATPPIANNTIFYGAKDVALLAPINVAEIAPSGGIPPYNYEIVEDSGNPANLGISGATGNNIQVRLTTGDTPGAGAAAERFVTVKVTDTGDTANDIDPEEQMVIVQVSFVEVEPHGQLFVENTAGDNLGNDFVVVTSGVSAQDVVLAPAASVYPERPTRRQDLGREAGVVSEVSHHGLRFNSNGLVITANTPLEGQTLSVVVQATDGATSQPTAAAQAAARQDQTYTISVRYVPAVAAEVLSTTDAALSNTDVVELTVVAGTQLVGKVSASGGVGGTYSYTPTPAQAGGTNLAVDADGNINIIAGTTPVAGDGLSITVNIAVDDDKDSTEANRDETSAANVQIRVKYVLLEDLALTAKDLQGNDVGTGATDTVGTFYLLEGARTDAQVLVATVTASGGIKDYEYALEGTGGDLAFDPATRAVHIKSQQAAAAPDSAGATLAVTVKATDSQSPANDKLLTVRAVFETVQTHGDLIVINGGSTLGINLVSVVTAADSNPRVVADNVRPTRGETGVRIEQVAAHGLEYVGTELRIVGGTEPTGQTLSVELRATDGGTATDRADKAGARPDQLYTVQLRYIRALAAVARNDDGTAVLNAPVVITSKATTHIIASISVSGGTSNTYSYTGESTIGPDLVVNASTGIVSIPSGVAPEVGGLNIVFRVTANDTGTNDDATDPATALVTVDYHLLESPEIVAQDKDGTAALTAPGGANAAVFYQLSGIPLANDLAVAKVVGSKGTSPYTFAIFGTNANGLEVDANTGNIILKSGESTTATGSAADRVITVRLTDSQSPVETADATITVRFEAVAPHGDLTFIAETGVTRNTDSEYVVVQAGTPSAAVPVLNFASVDSVSRTAGDAPLVFVSGSPNRLEIAANTVPTGQTITAEITQTDGDNNDLERTRPDRTYTVSVRYIPALAAEVRNANGVGALVLTDGTLVIEKESAASLNIASIAVSGGTSDTYTYSIDNKHTDNELEVSNDGIVYIPASVAPLPSTGLELTVEISANDSGDDNTATPAAVASITVRYVMDPGLGGQVQVAADNTPATSPTIIYRLVNDAAPAEGLDTGLKVVGLRGDTNAYTYANAGNTNPDGLAVDANTGVISILSGQTPDNPTDNKVRLLTVKISGVRNGNPREALVTVSVQFLGVGRFGSLVSFSPEKDADKNPAGDYVLVRPGAVSQALVVIEEFGIGRADSVTKFGGASELILDENADSSRLRIAGNTVPGGNPPVPGGLTLVANLQANDDDSTPQKRVRPNRNGYLVTVVYLAEVDATVEDASNTEIPDLANVDISAPAGETSVYVADIVGSGGTGEYTYTKAATDGGVLEVDGNGQVWIPSGQTPTAGDGTDLHILVNVNDTGDGGNRDNSGFTDAKQIRIDVDYILEPGLGGVVQKVSDSTEVTSPTVIYRLANDAAPAGGLPTGLKVVGIRGEGTYTYAIDGTNNSKLVIDASSGEVSIAASAQPDGDEHVITVKITDSSTPAKEAMVTLTANFRAVQPISSSSTHDFLTQAQCHEGIRRNFGPNAELRMPAREEGFEFVNQSAPDSIGTCGYFGHFVDELGNFGTNGGSGDLLRTVVEANGLEADFRGTGRNNYETRVDLLGEERHTYTAGETTRNIVIAYNDDGAGADVTPEYRKTLIVVFPGIPSVDAVLNDAGGTAIPDIAAIEKRGPGNLSVFIGNIVASGGTGGLAIVKDATDGGELEIDNSGQVYIPDSVQPAAGAGNQLHLLVNINDSGANSDRTAQKQIRIEVDYIFEAGAPPLSGQVQDAGGNEVTAAHNVFQLEGYTVPPEGLDTGIKVVASNGESPYSYAVQGSADPGKLAVDETSGAISIQRDQTTGGFLAAPRTLTVRITDNASDTADVVVEVRLVGIEGHGALTRTPASGVIEAGGIYYVAQDGAQSGLVDVLNGMDTADGHPLNAVAGGSPELVFTPAEPAPSFVKGNLKIAASTAPTGQMLIITLRAHDGDDNPAELVRPDRFYEITVVYLNHLSAQLWDKPSGGATIDIATAIEKTSAAGASVFVGSVSVSGGTGAYTFGKGTCTNLDVDADGNVFIPTSAAAPVASPGTPGSCQVIINDSGDGSAATPAHGAFNVQVNHILGVVVSLPAADSGDINLTPLSSIENRVYVAQTGTQPVVLPSRLDHSQRFTVFTRNSESAAVAVYSVQYLPSGGVVGGVTEGAGSDFSVGQAAGGAKWHPVMLKAGNLKRWGQLLEARFVTSDNTGYTVTVLLSEELEDSALELGPIGVAGSGLGQNRPMQFNLPNDVEDDTDYPVAPAFQTIADFPGITVKGLVVNNQKGISSRGVRATTSAAPIIPLPISEYGDYFWNEDTKTLWRRGEVVRGGNPEYYVELWDTGANPKIIPAVVNFRATTRKLARMSWATNPGTISPSGSTTFEVQGGAQARNYSPFRDMHATVNAPFVIQSTSRTRADNNDWRFRFTVGLQPGASAGQHTATITVTDRGYTSFGTLTHTATATK